MAIINILKRKKKIEPKKAQEKPEIQIDKENQKKNQEKSKSPKKELQKAGIEVLFSPHITEKSISLSRQDQYVFKVPPKTNKIELRKAIEKKFNVNVIDVKTSNVRPKKIKFGKTEGWKKGYKKAIIRIKKGQKIDIT